MNSMRFIQQAIEVEARRQIAILEAGGSVDQETRLYDPDKGETAPCALRKRRMITAFPDPDLLPLEIDQTWVDDIAANLLAIGLRRKTGRKLGDQRTLWPVEKGRQDI